MKSSHYHRKGFGLKAEVEADLVSAYESDLITEIKQNGNTLVRNGIRIRLAESFGFCWGVDRAVSMAYETKKHFPERKIWITNEIIHNPLVNSHLKEMEVEFVPVRADGTKDLENIRESDVVIVPAFGASVQEMELLESKGCEVVDTTCPWVSRVWNRVVKYARGEYTAIIHGKYNHEETVATASRATTYLIVENLKESKWVCDYILNGGDKAQFLSKFDRASSKGFDPDAYLVRVGITNQTTMLKGETELIGKLFEKTMMTKYGPKDLENHFYSPGDTICDATQERQDAMLLLVDEPLDLMIVIGGFNSSNTGHLKEIAVTKQVAAYHIDSAQCIISANQIRHLPENGSAPITSENWFPKGKVNVGITAGASTPNQVVADVIEKLFSLSSEVSA